MRNARKQVRPKKQSSFLNLLDDCQAKLSPWSVIMLLFLSSQQFYFDWIVSKWEVWNKSIKKYPRLIPHEFILGWTSFSHKKLGQIKNSSFINIFSIGPARASFGFAQTVGVHHVFDYVETSIDKKRNLECEMLILNIKNLIIFLYKTNRFYLLIIISKEQLWLKQYAFKLQE